MATLLGFCCVALMGESWRLAQPVAPSRRAAPARGKSVFTAGSYPRAPRGARAGCGRGPHRATAASPLDGGLRRSTAVSPLDGEGVDDRLAGRTVALEGVDRHGAGDDVPRAARG